MGRAGGPVNRRLLVRIPAPFGQWIKLVGRASGQSWWTSDWKVAGPNPSSHQAVGEAGG